MREKIRKQNDGRKSVRAVQKKETRKGAAIRALRLALCEIDHILSTIEKELKDVRNKSNPDPIV